MAIVKDFRDNNVLGYNTAGLRNVGSYQVSGWPFITGSAILAGIEHKIVFPTLAKNFSVTLSGSSPGVIDLHFASTSSTTHVKDQHHYVTLSDGGVSTMSFEVKCKEFFLTARGVDSGYEIIAELTNIPTNSMPILTGSGITAHISGDGIVKYDDSAGDGV